MAATRTNRRSQATVLPIRELRASVDRIRKDVEDAVETIGKRAVDILPRAQRKQVDQVFDRISSVRGDVNKAVDGWRADLRKRYRVVRGTVDKRVTTLRKETDARRKDLFTTIEKEARRYADLAFKQLKLPVRGDIDAIKRRLTGLERRIESLEKNHGRKAVA